MPCERALRRRRTACGRRRPASPASPRVSWSLTNVALLAGSALSRAACTCTAPTTPAKRVSAAKFVEQVAQRLDAVDVADDRMDELGLEPRVPQRRVGEVVEVDVGVDELERSSSALAPVRRPNRFRIDSRASVTIRLNRCVNRPMNDAHLERRRRPRRRPTMHDVAARAGVALSSVSRALGNHPDVSKRMRRRVLEAASELGYEPNFLAQSLRTGSTQTIGFVVRDIANPFFAAIANGAEQLPPRARLRDAARQLRRRPGHRRRPHQRAAPATSRWADPQHRRPRTTGRRLDAIAGLAPPIVLVDREIPELDVSAVLCDHYTGVRAATEDLIAHGHRRIALITGQRNVRPVRERIRGMTDAMAATPGSTHDDRSSSSAPSAATFAYDQISPCSTDRRRRRRCSPVASRSPSGLPGPRPPSSSSPDATSASWPSTSSTCWRSSSRRCPWWPATRSAWGRKRLACCSPQRPASRRERVVLPTEYHARSTPTSARDRSIAVHRRHGAGRHPGCSARRRVTAHVVPVELPAEPGTIGQGDRAVLERRLVGDEVVPDRVARGWKISTNVPCGIEQSRWLLTCASSWWAMRTPNVAAIAATRRHSVGPPDHEASKLQKSTAPSTNRSRHPPAENSLWPAHTAWPLISRTSRIARRSFAHSHGSSNQ